MKFRIVNNPSYEWRKYKRRRKPKTQKAIPDKDLCMQKGPSYEQALQAEDDYFYKGRPYGVESPHV